MRRKKGSVKFNICPLQFSSACKPPIRYSIQFHFEKSIEVFSSSFSFSFVFYIFMWQVHLINVVFISQHNQIVRIDLQLRKHKERRIYNKDSWRKRNNGICRLPTQSPFLHLHHSVFYSHTRLLSCTYSFNLNQFKNNNKTRKRKHCTYTTLSLYKKILFSAFPTGFGENRTKT